MRYGAEHKQKTRERVLTEAARAIRADGPHQLGVAAVMKQAGLTHGGFYAHFDSKEDLVAAAIGQMFEQGRVRLDKSLLGRPPAEGLRDYVGFYLSAGHRDALGGGCPLPFLSADAPRLSGASRERFAKGVAGLTARLAEAIKAIGHPHADDLAASVLAECVGALGLARAEPDLVRSDLILQRSRDSVLRRLGLLETGR